jgi:hypothetical protein
MGSQRKTENNNNERKPVLFPESVPDEYLLTGERGSELYEPT